MVLLFNVRLVYNLPDQFMCFFCVFCLDAPLDAHLDTHDIIPKAIATTYGVPTWGPFRLLRYYHPNEKAECLCGWMENRGGSSIAGRTINPLCGLCEFWSLTCYTPPVLLVSNTATVTRTNCLPSRVNVLLQNSGSPLSCHCCNDCCCSWKNTLGWSGAWTVKMLIYWIHLKTSCWF